MLLTDEDSCEGCKDKIDDNWGRFCDIACSKHFVHTIRQEAYKEQLKNLGKWGNEPCFCHDTEHRLNIVNLFGLDKVPKRHECPECWQALLEEVKE